MKVLILGANGMLGHALQDAFTSDDVIAWGQEDLDITNCDAVYSQIPKTNVDVVLNAAAYTDVEGAEHDHEIAEKVNGCAVGILAQACKRLDIPLLQVSTDYVFGNEGGEYHEEDRPHTPINSYGTSKLLGEECLREQTDKHWIVRTSWLFGEHGKNFVSTMLKLGEKEKRIKVVSDQEGCPTYTPDLAKSIHDLVVDKTPYGVYHLVNTGVTTWADFAENIFTMANMDVEIERITSEEFEKMFNARARRPARSVLWNTKRPSLRLWSDALHDFISSGA